MTSPPQLITIGVVEDSDEDFAALERVARRNQHEIELERWTRAEDLLAESHADPARTAWPDLLLIDLSLPGLDGSQLVAQLRTQIATRPLPLFIVSGSNRPSDIDRCYEAGASLYLNKPLRSAHVDAAVELLTASPAWKQKQARPGG